MRYGGHVSARSFLVAVIAVLFACLLLVATVSCRRRDSGAAPDAGAASASPPRPSSPATVASQPAPPSVVDAGAAPESLPPGLDFDDQFAFGGFDAGIGDRALLTVDAGFAAYDNERFGFHLDVPKALRAMPEPTNGDGQQWRLGNLVSLTASGMINVIELRPACARSKHVTARTEAKESCFATGKRDGFIFWERFAVKNEVMYSLRFQYVEALKETMDPIVTRVNRSWTY
jgi:hypothetical protein